MRLSRLSESAVRYKVSYSEVRLLSPYEMHVMWVSDRVGVRRRVHYMPAEVTRHTLRFAFFLQT